MFLPTFGDSIDEVSFYHKKFMCAEKEDLVLRGDFNSYQASLFNVQLKKCTDRPDCKSPEEITQFLRDKWLLVLYNHIRFDSRKYG